MVVRKMILFHIAYQVEEGDQTINMRASTESLEQLHKLLCGMDGFQTPLAQWHSLEVHEVLDNGTVAIIPQAHLANLFDYLYGFSKKQVLALEHMPEAEPQPLTAVNIVRRKRTQPLLSTSPWWKEKSNAY